MQYFLFIPSSNTWSEQAFSAVDLLAMPGLSPQTLVCESEGERRTLYLSQLAEMSQGGGLAPAVESQPVSAPQPTFPTTPAVQAPAGGGGSVGAAAKLQMARELMMQEEQVNTYRIMRRACYIFIYMTIMPLAVGILGFLGAWVGSAISEQSGYVIGISFGVVIGLIVGFLCAYTICDTRSK